MALATLTDVKTHLGITGTDEDTRLTAWLAAAIAAVNNACQGVDFESSTRTEYYQPDGYQLITKHRPISSVTSVYEDPDAKWGDVAGSYGASTLLTEGEDYALVRDGSGLNGEIAKSGIIVRINRRWAQVNTPLAYPNTNYQLLTQAVQPSVGAVKLVYVAGYTTVPADVTTAVCFEVDAIRQKAGKGGQQVTSESLGEYSYSAKGDAMGIQAYGYLQSAAAAALLQPYLALRVAL